MSYKIDKKLQVTELKKKTSQSRCKKREEK